MANKVISLNSLLLKDGDDFLNDIYVQLLGRHIDPGGWSHYLNKLNSGIPKTTLIREVCSSGEFKKAGRSIVDKDGLLKIEMFTRVPLIKGVAKKYLIHKEAIAVATTSTSEVVHYHHSAPTQSSSLAQSAVIVELRRKVISVESENIELKGLLTKLQHLVAGAPDSENECLERVCLNLSTTRRWRSRAVGIVRTEREIAQYLYHNYPNAIFTIWHASTQTFRLVPRASVREMLSDSWTDSNYPVFPVYDELLVDAIEIDEKTTFISVGLDWDENLTKHIFDLKNKTSCKVVLACYDLVPILWPEHTVGPHFQQLFRKHFVDMAYTADIVWSDSHNSANDLKNFWTEVGLSITPPPIQMIELGSDLPSVGVQNKLSEVEQKQLREIEESGEFALYVSTFETRKNHKLLLDVWYEGYRDYGKKWPTLVLVGRRGWGSEDLIGQMHRMKMFEAKKIIWIDNASDHLLHEIYRMCSFTLFPSFYEGWGLGAAESMAYGKPCIVSNNSSLGEATHMLMPQLSPYDFLGWKKQVATMAFDKDYRASLEELIQNKYQLTTWASFSKRFLTQTVDGLVTDVVEKIK